MLITIGLRSRPPSSAVFRHIQRIYQMEIAHVYIAALLRQMFCYLFILFFINFHTVYSMNSKHLKRQCEQNLILFLDPRTALAWCATQWNIFRKIKILTGDLQGMLFQIAMERLFLPGAMTKPAIFILNFRFRQIRRPKSICPTEPVGSSNPVNMRLSGARLEDVIHGKPSRAL